MKLLGSIQDIGLLTKKSIPLVKNVLNDLGSSPAVFDSEGTVLVAPLVLLPVKLSHTVLTISAVRGLLVIVDAEVAGENAENVIKTVLLSKLLVINGLQELLFVYRWRVNLDSLGQVAYVAGRGRQIASEIFHSQAVVQRDVALQVFRCVKLIALFEIQLLQRA